MLFAKIDCDGTMTIRAMEPIEEYALRHWEQQHKSGKAKLVIETGEAISLTEVIGKLGKTVVEFQMWYLKQEEKAVVDGIVDMSSKR